MAVRAHRIAEAYLVRVLEYGWHEAHDTADRLGEIADDVLVARMEKQAGFPRRCPHGEPIPRADGTIEIPEDLPLTQVAVGGKGIISRVKARDADRLQYLAAHGVLPEAPFEVAARAPFDGPVRVSLPASDCVLGLELARLVWVELEGGAAPTAA
jgi:DtxR family Mn-dependent transcriptional regulator